MRTPPFYAWVITVLLAAAVFAVECNTSLAFNLWVLYLLPIGMAYWIPGRWTIISFVGICSLLVVVGFFLGPTQDDPLTKQTAFINRLIGVGVFWFVGVLLDWLKQLVNALHSANEDLRQAMNAVNLATWQNNLDSAELHCDQHLVQLFGMTGAQMGSSPAKWLKYIHSDDRSRVEAAFAEASQVGGPPFNCEFRFMRNDGSEIWFHSQGRLSLTPKGERVLLGVTQDITRHKNEQQRIEAALREHQQLQQLFINHAPAALAMFDREMRYLAVSRRWMTDYRLSEADVLGRSHYDIFSEIPERWKEMHRRALNGEILSAEEDYFIRLDGRKQWVRWELRPWYQADNVVGGIMIFTDDITERKEAEEALRDREEHLQAILNTANDAIITIDRQGIIQSVNPATGYLFGYSISELLGQNVKMLMPSPNREGHDDYIARYIRTGQTHVIGAWREVVALRKDGAAFPIELAVAEILHQGLFTGIIRDISRRKQLELEIVEIASLEQRRIGQDLHDTVCQELTALSIQIADLAKTLHHDNEGVVKLVEALGRGLKRCNAALRNIMNGLPTVPVEISGLVEALAKLAEQIQEESKVNCLFDCPVPVTLIDNHVATHLYLIVREAVHNAIKHAAPRNVQIRLEADEFLRLCVQDDGIGISEDKLIEREIQGLGLRIMRNRASIIGAMLSIERIEPTGTRVLCNLRKMHYGRQPERQTGHYIDS